MDEYVRRLYRQYPEMLTDPDLPFGRAQLGIFDGWEEIFERFLKRIAQRVIEQVSDPKTEHYPLGSTVKQRFGKIRIYLARAGSVKISDLIERLEEDAVKTYYSCGAPATLTMVDRLAAPRRGCCEAEDRGSRLN